MANADGRQSESQIHDQAVPLILRNPRKAVSRATIIGFAVGLIASIFIGLVNLTAPPSNIDPANIFQRHSTIFILVAFPLGFAILGFSPGTLSWLAMKMQSEK